MLCRKEISQLPARLCQKRKGLKINSRSLSERTVAQEPKSACSRRNEIADVVSGWTKIPVNKLTESEAGRLAKLEQILHKRVIGQEEAVSAVAKAVRRGRVGLKDPKKPIGSFLFWDRQE